MEEYPQKYQWTFSKNKKGFLTAFQSSVHGDMNIYQISPWIIRKKEKEEKATLAGLSLQQHSERVFFMLLLKYAQGYCKNLTALKEKSGLLSKIENLPDYGGNFGEDSGSKWEEEFHFKNDLIYLDPKVKLEGAPLGEDSRIELDKSKNLLLISKYAGGKQDAPPVILPPSQIVHALYGIIFLASYGAVRTSKKDLINRLDYWRNSQIK